nr:hypothetical protein [Clostridiales bacterium]
AVFCVLVLICLLLCSCGKSSYALDIGNTRIDSEIYAYYLDRAISENQKATFEEQKAIAKNMCAEYIAVNTKMAEYKLSATATQKNDISSTVNALWRLYYNYYEKIGVSKQTLIKIYESQAYKITLLLAFYDTNGFTPVSEEQIKNHFTNNFIVFKSINDYLTVTDSDGNYVAMTGDALTQKQTSFKAMADKIQGEVTIDTVYGEYMTAQGQTATEIATSVISKDSNNYPQGFFERVKAIAENDADAVTLGNYIFCVQHLNCFSDDNRYYNLYRQDCLISLVSNDFEKILDKWTEKYSIKENAITTKRVEKAIEKNKLKKEETTTQETTTVPATTTTIPATSEAQTETTTAKAN